MIIDYKDVEDLNRYKIMSDTVVPRPIAWIVTEDDGVINAAPFSYFIPISSNPATLIVSIGQKEPGVPKDTLANILKYKKATICFVNKNNIEEVKKSALALEKNQSEIEEFEIDVQKVLEDYPAMISSSQTALFCELYGTVDIPGKTTPLILEIKKQFIEDERIDERFHVNVDNVGRCGAYFKAMVDL
ncbi:flavin reductase family protein [Malaciobacter marinus]|jgi:flavin reductase (DIM6/NTAB) family NADH-FMN oxidoreductase RutF|uniref:flavin reductase family protein n=1 Tax=Malaciobacter marinus TaxID=505249 RepID=UPI0009A5884B|nr:flavin reductase [Malaciobacter marinus]SKB58117.1 NADH-FMN oxidoreductase RutF, flavin reductase (DIM6/NTAB) family [Malaciobacter marinus]